MEPIPQTMHMRSHSIDGFPRLLFTSSMSQMSDLTANNRVGIVLSVVISLLQFKSRDIVLNEGKVDVD